MELNIKPVVGWILVIGALNWGLVGLLNMNLVESVLGTGMLTKVVYMVVGAAGLYKGYMLVNKMSK